MGSRTRIVHFSEFADAARTEALAESLRESAIATQGLLQQRNLRHVLARYTADDDTVRTYLQKQTAQAYSGPIERYAVVSGRHVVGGASVVHNWGELKHFRAPVSHKVAKILSVLSLEKSYCPPLGPQILAWTDDIDLLEDAYSSVLNGVGIESPAWTLEPQRSPQAVQDAISLAADNRLSRIISLRFNDSEGGIPPISHLYADRFNVAQNDYEA